MVNNKTSSEELRVSGSKFNINFDFYYILKFLIKVKPSSTNVARFINICYGVTEQNVNSFNENFINLIEEIIPQSKRDSMYLIAEKLTSTLEIRLFLLAIRLYVIKDVLLSEAKLTNTIIEFELQRSHPLSLKYDTLSLKKPYSTRVNWALMSLLFFSSVNEWKTSFLSDISEGFIEDISKDVIFLQKFWLEPNQIFMLVFSESINQSIISESWNSYEDRLLSILVGLWIPKQSITKTHDKADQSTEYDFFFDYKWRTYWIWAKRTLRERYKQFIKTSIMSEIDVMIEVTLWIDLNEQKAKNILSHWVKIFVADEVYKSQKYLQDMDWVFSANDLTIETLEKL